MTKIKYAIGCQQPVSVLMCDIDRFRSINDRYGHEFGDAVLVRIGTVLRIFEQRHDCVVCRYGGEEFAILLPEPQHTTVEDLAEQVRKDCAMQLISTQTASASVTVSIGVATSVDADLQTLMRSADIALYEAKASGRNRVISQNQVA